MKNLTILKALEIGFSYEDSGFETKEELEQEIMDYLSENTDKLEQREDECEVSSNGRNQHVSYGNYECSGEILQYGPKYWYSSPETKHFHSSFLLIEKDGTPVCMNLYQLTGENEYNTPKEEYNG